MASKGDLIQKLLKGIETGDAAAAAVANEVSNMTRGCGRQVAVETFKKRKNLKVLNSMGDESQLFGPIIYVLRQFLSGHLIGETMVGAISNT